MHTTSSSRRSSLRTAIDAPKRLLALAALLAFPATAARATLTLDLRSTDSPDPKFVSASAGTLTTFHFDLYAVVTGQDTNLANDGFYEGFFSLISSNTTSPGLPGTLTVSFPQTPVPAWAQLGTAQDLDGDGDLDIGSNDSTRPDDWIFASLGSMKTGQSQYLLARVTFTPTAPFAAGQTQITVVPRVTNSLLVVPAFWQEDGEPAEPFYGYSYVAGPPVTVSVPEPTTALALAPLTLTLLPRRRRRPCSAS